MTRIGSNSGSDPWKGFGSNKSFPYMAAKPKVPHDPFSGIQRQCSDGWNFHHYSRLVTWGLAKEWFSNFSSVSALDYLTQQCGEEYAKWAESRWSGLNWFGNEILFPEMLVKSHGLGELIPLVEGKLSSALKDYFNSREVMFIELPITYSDKRVVESDQQMVWVAPFGTSFGTRCFVSIESRIDQNGLERCHLFTNLLVNSRWPVASVDGIDVTKVISNYFIPLALIRLMFLAETTLPSSLISMSRLMVFNESPKHLVPKPIFSIEDYYPAFTHFPSSNDDIRVEYDIYPQVIRIGYEITSEMINNFENVIPTCVDSLVRACSIVEDGFRNYRDPNKSESFDFSFFSIAILNDTFREGQSHAGAPRWIPETHLSELRYSTMDFMHYAYTGADDAKKREICQWAADEGIGSLAVASAINTLAYSYLIPEEKFNTASWYLNEAVNLEAINESTNAMANMGAVCFKAGELDWAISWLMAALNREDKFAETEACMLLGEIYLSQDKKTEAIEYLQRGSRGPDDKFSRRCKEILSQIDET
jgi:hypothetical protein